jgi:CelD/BcsL family acetyltransferase involved in cellulose biosynthesis
VELLADAGCAVRRSAPAFCPYLDLRELSWDTLLAGLGPAHRANLRRRLRVLERGHTPRFELVGSEARRRELLPVLFELHRRRWAERGGSDGLLGPGLAAFHDQVSRLALRRGWLRLFVLWLGDVPAAALYCFRYREGVVFYQSGFDPGFARLGVGLVALGLALRSAVEEGAGEFDLLHGEEPYKFLWAKRRRPLAGFTVFPAGAHGRLAWGHDAAKDFARVLLRRPPGAERPHAATAR